MNRIAKLKRYLNSAWYWDMNANRLLADIKRLRSQAEKVTAAYSHAPTFGGYEDRRQSIMDEMIEKERKFEDARRKSYAYVQEIRLFIGLLEDYKERSVCEHRYLSYYGWLDIAMALNYSISNVKKIHDNALENLLRINDRMQEASGKSLF